AVSKFEHQIGVDVVGQTRVSGPREIPLRTGRRAGVAHGAKRQTVDAIVGEVRDRNPRATNTGADERRNAPPGTKIDIRVGQDQPFRLAGAVVVDAAVGYSARGPCKAIDSLEICVAAVLPGDVSAEPAIEAVTGTKAEDAGAIE